MNVFAFRSVYYVVLLISLGALSACGQKTETSTATVPIDTTVVDDDTLEVNDTARFKQTEHAR
ncbi:lipoprotein [Spirosoma linguale]|uniref:Uncharacterized protein n=1 Tax=Spirosoma linguale (strain ATCC 33905 / DSM 74 / LMG 10896 / Claus 1) TaxID=504472 RepID=D2QJE8_SPILD|nr:hypothetical protein Slin_2847 [Spirosoma linguale DSM 74]